MGLELAPDGDVNNVHQGQEQPGYGPAKEEPAAQAENHAGQETTSEVCVVRAMLTMVAHPRDILMTEPSNIRRWSEQILKDEQTKRRLHPDAITGLIMAPGVSVDKAMHDLPEQMRKFMKSEGLNPRRYDTESFAQCTKRENVKFICMIASPRRKR